MFSMIPTIASSILGGGGDGGSVTDAVTGGGGTDSSKSSASASFGKGDFIVTKSDSTLQIAIIAVGVIGLFLVTRSRRKK